MTKTEVREYFERIFHLLTSVHTVLSSRIGLYPQLRLRCSPDNGLLVRFVYEHSEGSDTVDWQLNTTGSQCRKKKY
jgi:hypothetical protein